MRRVVGLALCVALLSLGSRPCEASQVSQAVNAVWGWMTSPINAIAILGQDLLTCGSSSLATFVQNVLANANPDRIVP